MLRNECVYALVYKHWCEQCPAPSRLSDLFHGVLNTERSACSPDVVVVTSLV